MNKNHIIGIIVAIGIIGISVPAANAFLINSELSHFVDYESNQFVWNPNDWNYTGTTTINVTDIGNFDIVEYFDKSKPTDVHLNGHEIIFDKGNSVSIALPVLLYLDKTVIELEEENKTQDEIIEALENKAGLQGKKIKHLQSQILDLQAQIKALQDRKP